MKGDVYELRCALEGGCARIVASTPKMSTMMTRCLMYVLVAEVDVLLSLTIAIMYHQDVYHDCQDDAESDDVDVKQVMEHVVSNDADHSAKMM